MMLDFNKTTSSSRLKLKLGFTLIELLVVIAIMSVLMGLVGPLALKGLDKAKSREEVMTLNRWLDDLAYRAFLSQVTINLRLSGKQASASSDEVNFLKVVDFDYIYFQPQTIVFNHHGFSSQTQISYQQNQQDYVLEIPRTLSVK